MDFSKRQLCNHLKKWRLRGVKKASEDNPSSSISDFMSVMEWEESIKYRIRLRLLAEARTAWEEYFKWLTQRR